MRRFGLCFLLLVALAGCGKSNDSNASTQFTAPSSAAKATPKAPAAKPTTTFKNIPQCRLYNAYSLAYSGTTLAKAAKRAEAVARLEKSANALKAAAADKSGLIDEQVTLVKRAGTVAATPQDPEKMKKNAQDLQKWYNDTCL